MVRNYQKAAPEQYQRLPEYQRADAWIGAFLKRGLIAQVAHTDQHGQPFITATNYWFDEENHQILFHSNIAGRIRSNLEHQSRVCVSVSEYGKLLPANTALEFSIQYRSVITYGKVVILQREDQQQRALYGLLGKYFPQLTPGKEYRPITKQELLRTSVYAVEIESWSGKENWPDQAIQSTEWPDLAG